MIPNLKLYGAIALVVGLGISHYVAWSKGVAYADGKWQQVRDKQVAEASRLLADNINAVLEKERQLSAISAKLETDHATHAAEIDAASAKYDRLGKLFERTKAGCRNGGGDSAGEDTAAARVDPDNASPEGIVSGPPNETLGAIARDADRIANAFKTCQAYVREIQSSLE